jgi:serine/threonine-protein kinase
MTLSAGTRLGPYEILSPLGAGGMGEVYKAKDTRLDRTVAIKVLPEDFATDPDRRARFEREARAASALNHPHICTLHDIGHQDGVDYIVLEHLEGETLADRLANGPLPLDGVLRYGIEIAQALAAAHRAGILHRDLKPGNVMLTKSGAKLLDFGLAKRAGVERGEALSVMQTATQAKPLTSAGTVMGTIQYMSPEQLEAKEADARSDIWALGTLLYEMATGKRAFSGASQASIAAAILKEEPKPMRELQPVAPPALDRLVRACLAKDRDERMQSAGDVGRELSWMGEDDETVPIRDSPGRRMNILLGTLAGTVAGGLVATITVLKLRSGEPPGASSLKQLTVTLPSIELAARDYQGLALSPDGKHLVFPGHRAGVTQLYDRPMDRLEASPIPGTEGALQPFFSPDGRWVGFFAGGKLKKVALAGGTPVAICDARSHNGSVWGSDDTILFSDAGLFRVSAAGGSPQPVTTPDPGLNESGHTDPAILPNGQAILFTIWTGGYGRAQVAVQSLKSGQRQLLFDGQNPHFTPTGHIVFFRAGSLWAAPFDSDRLKVIGSPTPVVQGVHSEWGLWSYFALAGDGTLAYLPGAFDAKRLVWVDRKGAVAPLGAPPKPYDNPVISPDGQRLAIVIREENNDVWSYELARGTLTRLTSDPGEDETPIWMPDGTAVAFAGNRSGGGKLLSRLADGSGTDEVLLGTRGGHRHVDSVSPDGQVLAFEDSGSATGSDIWVMPLHGERNPQPFVQTTFSEGGAKFSPDGRSIAYMSDESGRSEVYVAPYPGPGGRSQVSTDGGVEPVWARSGRELFFRTGDKMMVADVTIQPTFTASQPRVLFEGHFDFLPWNANYDVAPDGQRFLMVQPAEATGRSQINIVLNWFEELKRLVPSTHS